MGRVSSNNVFMMWLEMVIMEHRSILIVVSSRARVLNSYALSGVIRSSIMITPQCIIYVLWKTRVADTVPGRAP